LCRDIKFRFAESNVLAPLGLTGESYFKRQKELAPTLVRQIAADLASWFSSRVAEAIVTGKDAQGVHIYVSDGNGGISCRDSIGFASIGIGASHADSQFMAAGYHPLQPLPETLSLTFSAKKRAEAAPGVGKGTDMFSFVDSYTAFPDSVITRLGETWKAVELATSDAKLRATEEIKKLVTELIENAKNKPKS
jgi:hypothetical protein